MIRVGRNADAIRASLQALLPPGEAFSGPNTMGYLQAMAQARVTLEQDIVNLQREISPGTSVLLLNDYQAVLGPDPLGRDAGVLSVSQRQALLQARWVASGGARITDIEAVGADFGVGLDVTEPEPPVCGVARSGADRVGGIALRFYWICDLTTANAWVIQQIQQLAPADTVVVFRVNGSWL